MSAAELTEAQLAGALDVASSAAETLSGQVCRFLFFWEMLRMSLEYSNFCFLFVFSSAVFGSNC